MIGILNAGSDEVVFSSPRKSNLFNDKLRRSKSVNYLPDGRFYTDLQPPSNISALTMWQELIQRYTSTAKIDAALREGEVEEAAEKDRPVITEDEEEGKEISREVDFGNFDNNDNDDAKEDSDKIADVTEFEKLQKLFKQHYNFHFWHHHNTNSSNNNNTDNGSQNFNNTNNITSQLVCRRRSGSI